MSRCSASAAAPSLVAPGRSPQGRSGRSARRTVPRPRRWRRASAASRSCCISGRGRRPGFWCQAATVRTPIPRCAANASLLIRSAACSAHAVRPVQPVTTSMTRRRGKAEMTATETTPGASARLTRTRAGAFHYPPHPGGAHCHWRAARSLWSLAIRLLAVRPVSPHYGITRTAAPRGSRKPLTMHSPASGQRRCPAREP